MPATDANHTSKSEAITPAPAGGVLFQCDMTEQRAEDELRTVLSKEDFSHMHVCGQFNLGFIVVRWHDELFLVDQHASDEKYRFEKLQESTTLNSQALIR